MTEVSEFKPDMRQCPTHGVYQANYLDADGYEYFVPSCPICRKDAVLRNMLQRSAIPRRFQAKTFETYRVTDKKQAAVLTDLQAYAANFKTVLEKGQNRVLIGNPGTGKTHLACSAANSILDSGYTALFITCLDLIRFVRDTWADHTEAKALKALRDVDLLIIDEFGALYGKESESVTLFDIINKRYNDLRPLIILSNFTVQEISDYMGEKMLRRFREDGKLLIFDWEDYHKK